MKVTLQGGYYLPPIRNLNAVFFQEFFAGRKKLMQIAQIKFFARVPNFKELSIERLIAVFPHSTDEKASLPDHVPLLKLDRNYVLNASLKDHEHAQSGICRATTQNGFGTKKSAT